MSQSNLFLVPIRCHINPPESKKLLLNCDEFAAFDSRQLLYYAAVHIAGVCMHTFLQNKFDTTLTGPNMHKQSLN